MKSKFRHFYICFLLLLLFAGGCASLMAPVNQQEALRQRVDKLWQAKSAEDMRTFYKMTDNKYRKNHTIEQFLRGRNLIIQGYTIKNVKIDNNDPHKASSMVIFKTFKFAQPFTLSVKEEWLLEDGHWNLKLSDPRTPFDKRSK